MSVGWYVISLELALTIFQSNSCRSDSVAYRSMVSELRGTNHSNQAVLVALFSPPPAYRERSFQFHYGGGRATSDSQISRVPNSARRETAIMVNFSSRPFLRKESARLSLLAFRCPLGLRIEPTPAPTDPTELPIPTKYSRMVRAGFAGEFG